MPRTTGGSTRNLTTRELNARYPQLSQPVVPPRQRNSQVPAELERLILRALEYDPASASRPCRGCWPRSRPCSRGATASGPRTRPSSVGRTPRRADFYGFVSRGDAETQRESRGLSASPRLCVRFSGVPGEEDELAVDAFLFLPLRFDDLRLGMEQAALGSVVERDLQRERARHSLLGRIRQRFSCSGGLPNRRHPYSMPSSNGMFIGRTPRERLPAGAKGRECYTGMPGSAH